MTAWEIVTIAVALALDALAVALGVGSILSPVKGRQAFRLSFHFGLFQFLMPLLGYSAGSALSLWVGRWDGWVAAGLLFVVGLRMIYESVAGDGQERETKRDPTRGVSLVVLSVATSLDALAVGVSLALLKCSIWVPVLVIGVVAALFTLGGLWIGARAGKRLGPLAEVAGGIVLIAIGGRILLEHLTNG
jgi:putative Mn2+ efflux pump MntP